MCGGVCQCSFPWVLGDGRSRRGRVHPAEHSSIHQWREIGVGEDSGAMHTGTRVIWMWGGRIKSETMSWFTTLDKSWGLNFLPYAAAGEGGGPFSVAAQYCAKLSCSSGYVCHWLLWRERKDPATSPTCHPTSEVRNPPHNYQPYQLVSSPHPFLIQASQQTLIYTCWTCGKVNPFPLHSFNHLILWLQVNVRTLWDLYGIRV